MRVTAFRFVIIGTLMASSVCAQTRAVEAPAAGIEMNRYEPMLHVQEAAVEANKALKSGKAGDSAALQKHSEYALKHARSAQPHINNDQLESGIKSLEEAAALNKKGQGVRASKLTEKAYRSFSTAGESLNQDQKY